ncbi:MAG: hypothetical protein Q8910_00370 [Bacteroidota bacterium]|nr:hypothetical protein [Bacteroidota bacterium]
MDNHITEIKRSVLPSNEAIVKEAQAKLATPGKSREEKSNAIKEAFAAEFKPKIAGYDKARNAIIDLYVPADNIWLDFFQYKTLTAGEDAKYYEKSLPVEIPIRVVSNFGGYSTIQYTDGMSPISFEMKQYQTDGVRYAKYDMRQGFVDKSEAITETLNRSVDKFIDNLALNAFNGSFGAFDSHVWVLDDRIKNAPTTNDFDLRSTCNGRITPALFRAIINHFARMEKGVRAVYLPAARRGDEFDWVTFNANDLTAIAKAPDSMIEEIWRQGSLPSGALIPPCAYTNRLEGETANGVFAYAVSDDPDGIGYFYQQPEAHYTETLSDRTFWETYKAFTAAFIQPAYLKSNVARFQLL